MLAVRSAKNTLGCLIGCAIGDLGAIYLFKLVMLLFDSIGTLDDCLDSSNEFGNYSDCDFGTIILWK